MPSPQPYRREYLNARYLKEEARQSKQEKNTSAKKVLYSFFQMSSAPSRKQQDREQDPFVWRCLRLHSLARSWSDQGAPLRERDLSAPRHDYTIPTEPL